MKAPNRGNWHWHSNCYWPTNCWAAKIPLGSRSVTRSQEQSSRVQVITQRSSPSSSRSPSWSSFAASAVRERSTKSSPHGVQAMRPASVVPSLFDSFAHSSSCSWSGSASP